MSYDNSEYVGKRLRDIKYNNIPVPFLSVFDNDVEVAFGSIGDVLRKIPDLANKEVKSSNYFFNALVLRV